MKTRKYFRSWGLTLIAIMLMIGITNAQSRYKHLPRVKVEVKKTEKVDHGTQKITTTSKLIEVEETGLLPVENITYVENTTVASTNEEVIIVTEKTRPVVKSDPIVRIRKIIDRDIFTTTLKENSRLMEVKEVKKTYLQKWLLIMIILLAVGVVCFILGAIFSFTFGFGWIFWTLGGLCWVAALVVLILGLTGVM